MVPGGSGDAVVMVRVGVEADIVKVDPADVAPPGLTTVTMALPAFAIRLAGTRAVS